MIRTAVLLLYNYNSGEIFVHTQICAKQAHIITLLEALAMSKRISESLQHKSVTISTSDFIQQETVTIRRRKVHYKNLNSFLVKPWPENFVFICLNSVVRPSCNTNRLESYVNFSVNR